VRHARGLEQAQGGREGGARGEEAGGFLGGLGASGSGWVAVGGVVGKSGSGRSFWCKNEAQRILIGQVMSN
jgi:hypothetical protein